MVIKFTVSQTSGSFSSMRAGGVFYYWHTVLVNIINNVRARLPCLQENGAKLCKSTHRSICMSLLDSKIMKKNCTTAFYIVAVSIVCSFDRSFHNKKGGWNEKRGRGKVWETVNLIAMALGEFPSSVAIIKCDVMFFCSCRTQLNKARSSETKTTVAYAVLLSTWIVKTTMKWSMWPSQNPTHNLVVKTILYTALKLHATCMKCTAFG